MDYMITVIFLNERKHEVNQYSTEKFKDIPLWSQCIGRFKLRG